MNIDIEKDFIINFDQLLIDCNNPIINSFDKYGKYKKEYLEFTQESITKYNNLILELNKIKPPMENNASKFFFTFVDTEMVTNIKNQIKGVILQQKQYFNKFVNYIINLNNEYINDINTKKIQLTRTNSRSSSHSSRSISRQRGLLAKLIPRSKTESKRVKFNFNRIPTK